MELEHWRRTKVVKLYALPFSASRFRGWLISRRCTSVRRIRGQGGCVLLPNGRTRSRQTGSRGFAKVVWPKVRRTRSVGIDRAPNELLLTSSLRDRCQGQPYLNLPSTRGKKVARRRWRMYTEPFAWRKTYPSFRRLLQSNGWLAPVALQQQSRTPRSAGLINTFCDIN